MNVTVTARCVACQTEREIVPGEVPEGELPMCDKCFSPMVAVAARGTTDQATVLARIPRSVGVSTCPFCDYAGPSKMLAPESWAKRDGVIVIEPINPVTRGHVLVIPTRHVENATDNPEVTGRVFKAAARWARIEGLSAFNLITSTGAAATQTVKHLHVHVVPRREGDGLALPWTAISHSGPGS